MASAPVPAAVVGPFMAAGPKDLVTTGLGASHVWATVGQGIVNEVYWPTAGEPQIRDLGFIVAGDNWWHEVKQVASYQVQIADPAVPLASIIHSGPADHPYQLTLEVVPDSERDVVLVMYALTGADARVYTLLASHLQQHPAANADKDYSGGVDNIAWVDGGSLFAQRPGRSLCLSADHAFSQASVGYFGSSDLWQDFSQHNAMSWDFTHAGPGFVVLGAELAAASGTLALAFAGDPATASGLTGQSLAAGVDAARAAMTSAWQAWSASGQLPPPTAGDPASLGDALRQSATVLRVHQDHAYPGATVAGLSTPWGDTSNNPGGYHLVWPRDAVECGFALALSGHSGDAQQLLDYLVGQQQLPDGYWQQNFYPDGTPYWTGIQLDETALPVMLAAKLDDLGHPPSDATKAMIARAVGYLVRNGPLSPQDRWEEDSGGSPFTLGVIIAALVAGAKYLDAASANYALALADNWNERLEEWTYVAGSWLDRVFGLDGHYVRVGPDPQKGAARIANQPNQDFAVPSSGVLGLEFAYLARLGLRSSTSKAMSDTAQLADIMLGRDVGTGVAYYRYNYDGYGEDYQGANWTGAGTGRLWPLLSGERGHLAVLAGHEGLTQLTAMLNMRTPSGLLPEQVWDQPPLTPRNGIPSLQLNTGQRTLSATPLAWAHSELIKLAWTRATQTPAEQLTEVTRRYSGQPPSPSTSYWRITVPFSALPAGRDLVIEDTQPFTLHYGFGDPGNWTGVSDADSNPLPFDMHGVTLAAATLAGQDRLNFIRRYGTTWDPNHDQTIVLQQAPLRQLRQHSSQGGG
jgi:glucoamylase